MFFRKTADQPVNRAEALRQKRKPSSHTPVMPSKKPEPKPVQQSSIVATRIPSNRSKHTEQKPVSQPSRITPMMTARGIPYSTPIRQVPHAVPRRKVYHMGANGVETRLPALPNINFSWQWVSGLLTFGLTLVVILMAILPTFKVNQITIQGNQRVTSEEIQNVVFKTSSSIFTFDKQKAINAVGLAFPELSKIDLEVKLNGALELTVTERQPVIVWSSGDQTVWIDADGIVMPVRGDPGDIVYISSSNPLPIVREMEKPHSVIEYVQMAIERQNNPLTPEDTVVIINKDLMQAAFDFNEKMPEGSSLVYDSISGMGWTDPRGWKVYYGLSLDNIDFQQNEYETIANYLEQNGIKPTVISVEHIDAPFYRTD